MLRFFVLDPWVSEERTIKSGADLSEDEVRELVNGGQIGTRTTSGPGRRSLQGGLLNYLT